MSKGLVFGGIGGIAAIAAVAAYMLFGKEPEPAGPDTPAPAAAPVTAPVVPDSGTEDSPDIPQDDQQAALTPEPEADPEPEDAGPVQPVLDVVRVSADGQMVIAGSASPYSIVEIVIDGEVVGTAEADANGDFVTILDVPPSDAARELVLRVPAGGSGGATEPTEVALADTGTTEDPAPEVQPEAGEDTTEPDASTGTGGDGTAPASDGGTGTVDAGTAGTDGQEAPATEPEVDPATDETADAATDPATDAVVNTATDPATDQAADPATDPATDEAADPATDDQTELAVADTTPEDTAPAAPEPVQLAQPEAPRLPSALGGGGSSAPRVSSAVSDLVVPRGGQAPTQTPAPASLGASLGGPTAAPAPASPDPGLQPEGPRALHALGDSTPEQLALAPAQPVPDPAPGPATPTALSGAAVEESPALPTDLRTTEPDPEPHLPEPEPRYVVSAPVIILPSADAESRPVLIQPEKEDVLVVQTAEAKVDRIVLDQITYAEGGDVVMTGRANPGHAVRLYVNAEFAAEIPVAGDGSWRGRIGPSWAEQAKLLRFDEVSEAGTVTSRVEAPFQYGANEGETLELREREVVIQRGDFLWRIAEQYYGEGIRYSVIYQANSDLIRDPDLIYPGQIFTVPELVGTE